MLLLLLLLSCPCYNTWNIDSMLLLWQQPLQHTSPMPELAFFNVLSIWVVQDSHMILFALFTKFPWCFGQIILCNTITHKFYENKGILVMKIRIEWSIIPPPCVFKVLLLTSISASLISFWPTQYMKLQNPNFYKTMMFSKGHFLAVSLRELSWILLNFRLTFDWALVSLPTDTA